MMGHLPKKQGFTLIEVLIVVSILCLLAAILFPAFNRVRALGRRTTCASNLKQIGLALNQYAQDYRFYPVMDSNAYTDGRCGAWPDKVLSYTKSQKVFECPSSPYGLYRSACPPPDNSIPDHPINFRGSYNFNLPNAAFSFDSATGIFSESYNPRRAANPVRYTRPSNTILLVDGVNRSPGGFIAPGYTQPPATDIATLQNYGVPDRHEGGANVCFADGHVQWMRLDALLKRSLWRINGPE